MPENQGKGGPIHGPKPPPVHPMLQQPQMTPELKLKVLRATAVQQSVSEIMHENRAEIIRRARAKLVAMGIQLAPDEEIDFKP